jgi:hypothetical protein
MTVYTIPLLLVALIVVLLVGALLLTQTMDEHAGKREDERMNKGKKTK